jgi:hypothetical protein
MLGRFRFVDDYWPAARKAMTSPFFNKRLTGANPNPKL